MAEEPLQVCRPDALVPANPPVQAHGLKAILTGGLRCYYQEPRLHRRGSFAFWRLATVLLVECLSRETRVQVAQTFGEAPVLSALEAAREREAQAEAARARRLNALRLPEADDARHETHVAGVAYLMRQRAANKLGSAV